MTRFALISILLILPDLALADCQERYRALARWTNKRWRIVSATTATAATFTAFKSDNIPMKFKVAAYGSTIGLIGGMAIIKGAFEAKDLNETALALDQAENEDGNGWAFDKLYQEALERSKGAPLDRSLLAKEVREANHDDVFCRSTGSRSMDNAYDLAGKERIIDYALPMMRRRRPETSEAVPPQEGILLPPKARKQ